MRQSTVCRRLAGVLLLSCPAVAPAEEALDVEGYVAIVLRAHPSAAQSAGLDLAARAERKAARLFPDPVFEYSRDRGTLTEPPGTRATETGWSVSQTIPWPGTFRAGIRAGDRAADALRGPGTAAATRPRSSCGAGRRTRSAPPSRACRSGAPAGVALTGAPSAGPRPRSHGLQGQGGGQAGDRFRHRGEGASLERQPGRDRQGPTQPRGSPTPRPSVRASGC